MNKLAAFFMMTLIIFSQDLSSIGTKKDQNFFDGGVGFASIDGQTYYTFTLTPEFTFGKVGVGLNIELMFHPDDGFRSDMYDNGAGWLRAIRYVRYGYKGDSLYARLGTIDNGTLGNGFVMFHYSNASNYDQRKIGLQFDMDFGDYGFESLYSNFGRAEILGLRGYYRPLTKMDIPILNTLEIGTTYVTDFYNRSFNPISTKLEDDAIAALGLDLGVKVLDMQYLKWKFYFDYGSIANYGSGTGVGSAFVIPDIAGLFEFGIKYEIRWIGDEFLPSLFNTNYELLRAQNGVSTALLAAKETNGDFSEIALSFLNLFTVRGNYSKLHDVNNGGLFYAELIAPDLGDLITIGARYSKAGLNNFSDSFDFDTRSVAEFEFGYQLNDYILVSTLYRYNWIEKEDKDGNTVFKSQETILPQIKFRYQF